MSATPPAEFHAQALRTALDRHAVPGRAAGEKRYLRSDLDHIGVPLPALRKLARSFVRSHRELTHDELLALVVELWKRPVHEARSVALILLDHRLDLLRTEDTAFLERLLRDCGTWAHVDLLAPFVVGRLLLREPGVLGAVRRWAADERQWVRRGGVLSFLPAVRQEAEYPRWFPVFGEVADPLLTDDRFFVRKAIGWVLREGTGHHPRQVADWLEPRLHRVSGLTLREAVRRLDEQERRRLLAAHHA
ncbi:DNA alkylation repair protein [Streptomyces asiaticus]